MVSGEIGSGEQALQILLPLLTIPDYRSIHLD